MLGASVTGLDLNWVAEFQSSTVTKCNSIEMKVPFRRHCPSRENCLSTEDIDIKKDVLFLDKIMNSVQNKETSALFTPFVIKLEQICNAGRVSLRKRIKTNNAAIATHGDSTSNSDDEE